ncbi:MAG: hypothetical protein NDJ90_01850, partial [Oligoflexia bacterium]|nr:hypothetical protein [Oligoflexia bacterium]
MIGTLGLLLWTVAAQAKGLELASQYESVLEPLTTEKVWTLDPEELNPHRQRWVLHRQVRLKGLEARKLGAERFGVRAKVLESVTRGYVRGDGPWYRPFSEFPCGEEQAWFATKEGAREALEAGAAAWSELLKRELVTLDLRLERIAEKSGPNAVRFALVAYEDWLRRLEGEWRGELKARIRQSEWTRYREVGTDAGICAKGGAARAAAQPPVVVPSWENLMEPPGAPAQAQARSGPAKPLARTPARRWNGLYSVRLSVQVGTRSLTGQFLLDSTTYRSILNPAWLAMQGMLPVWIEIPGARPERVTMSGTTALGPR